MTKRFKRFWKNLWDILRRPDMTVLPAQLAYYFILSLVPTLTIIFYVASFLKISLNDVTSYLNLGVDSALLELLMPVVGDTSFHFGLIILLIVGIYLASNGTSSVIVSANNIYGIEQKSFLHRRIKAIIMVLIIILLFLFILLVPVLGNFLLSLIEKITGYSEIYNVLNFLKTPFSWFVIFLFIKVLYTLAPDKEIPSAHVNLGAMFTSLGWIIATEVYLYYAKHFAHYTLYYSGLSNLAILMIWIYILAMIFVIGMGLNYKEEPYEIEKTQKLEELRLAKKNQHKEEEK